MSSDKCIQVLMVEDDPGDVDLTKEALKDSKLSMRIAVVEDGEQAVKYLRRQKPYENAPRPDLILLDLNLPKMDGREVLKEIKCDPDLRTIPICVMTTSEAQADIQRAYGLGANCYVTKPLDLDQFIKVVHHVEAFWLTVVKLPLPPQ